MSYDALDNPVEEDDGSEDTSIGTGDGPILLPLAEFFYPLYKRIFREREEFVSRLESRLTQANFNTPVEIYMSSALGVGTILGTVFGVLSGGILYLLLISQFSLPTTPYSLLPFTDITWVKAAIDALSSLKIIVAVVGAALLGALFGLMTALGIATSYPIIKLRQRRRVIGIVMPDVVAFMYSLSVGGMDQLDIMRAVAESEDTYGEAAVEFQRIVKKMEYFNTDYRTAVQEVAQSTPSDDLSRFLTDMLSIINSGGDFSDFLETQKEYYLNEVRRKQDDHLDTLELFGEMYMSLSIGPMVLLIILVIMSLLGDPQPVAIMSTVYAGIPFINLMFIFLVSIIKTDEVGSGVLDSKKSRALDPSQRGALSDLSVVDTYAEKSSQPVFKQIQSHELRHRIGQFLTNPLQYFKSKPMYSLLITVPASLLIVGGLILTGAVELSTSYTLTNPLRQTAILVYIPMYIVLVPLAIFFAWDTRSRYGILNSLTDDLRKLANTNDSGQTLLASFKITGEDNDTKLSSEFLNMYKRVQFGQSLQPALIEFNNRYRIPRMARTVKLIEKAQESTSHITDVLNTAAQISENQDQLKRERKTRTRVQVVVIGVTFLVFLAVMVILKTYFIDRIVEIIGSDPEWGALESIDPAFLTTMFFHAAVLQAILSGYISGYIQTGKPRSGIKYLIIYSFIALVIWAAILL